MKPEIAIEALLQHNIEGKALQMAAYHKIKRRYLGVTNPAIDAEVKKWRAELDIDERVALADALWRSDIHEGRIAAAKLLTQARIQPDQAVWDLIKSWVPGFDGETIADHVCTAGRKRLEADPSRFEEIEIWTKSPDMWTRRAVLTITQPWTKQNNPKPADIALRDRVLDWTAAYLPDTNRMIQNAVAGWLRDLSKHDPDRIRAFLKKHKKGVKPFVRKEATRHLS
ncbi:MAG: DNA alkylation repair protein [Marinosulfonomonas sp.]|nr:DNA alkylation repair protein [Marinosulfonomonas sp.]